MIRDAIDQTDRQTDRWEKDRAVILSPVYLLKVAHKLDNKITEKHNNLHS